MHKIGRQTRAVALVCAIGALAGCDKLLEVDLPAAVTSDALENPSTAAVQVNSVIAGVECAYSSLAIDAAGFEDNFQMVSGVAGQYSQYRVTPAGGGCDGGAYTQSWVNAFLTARGQGYDVYESVSGWAVANQQRMLATLALYNAVTLGVFGEYFCEFAINAGPKMAYSETLNEAEGWADLVFTHAPTTFALTTQQGTITTDVHQTAYALRARIKYANGDLAGAAADAALVNDGHMAWILREEGEDRRNMVSSTQGNGGGVQAAGFLQGPVRLRLANPYGITELGSHPVTGVAWPNPVPFTGYLDLAIETATGRAVSDAGYPLTLADAGTEVDTRVEHAIGPTAGGPDNVIQKYASLADDIPLVNWREMRLIQAENAGASAAGVDFVNEIRVADGLPEVQGAYRTLVEGSAARFDDLLIEERRRALWLEARFWSTKILKNEKLWFPRGFGSWDNENATYGLNGGVRMLMPTAEYEINTNLDLTDRATGCPAGQRPIYN
jgi:hypothetical protein